MSGVLSISVASAAQETAGLACLLPQQSVVVVVWVAVCAEKLASHRYVVKREGPYRPA